MLRDLNPSVIFLAELNYRLIVWRKYIGCVDIQMEWMFVLLVVGGFRSVGSQTTMSLYGFIQEAISMF